MVAKRTARPEAAGKRKRRKCKHCDNKAQTRGVCFTCWQGARSLILSGETTDEKLVAEGFLDAPKTRGAKSDNRLIKAFKKRMSTKGGA